MQPDLPSYPTPFIGRTDEIIELSQLFDKPDCRLLTLVGPGGIGKTRLAVEVACRKVESFPDGVYFVPLQPLQTADQVLSAVIDTLSLQVTDDPQQQLLNYLRNRSLLLLLDNIEHVLDSVPLVSDILTAAAQVCILATSREVLNLQGEWVRQVVGLTWPDDENHPQHNDHYSALELFTDCARRARSDFLLIEERERVIHICRLVEGMPLALELAAGWLRVMPCEAIASEIQRNIDILTTHQRDRPERHQSMRAVFDQSWHMLTDEEQTIFRKLAVFRGSFALEAAQQVARATLEKLASLVDKSLVRVDDTGRYSLHELLRQFAAEQLDTAGEREAADKAHCDYYADFMQEREPGVKGGQQFETFAEIATEFENIRAAWHWAVDHRDYAAIDRGVECLYRYVCNQHFALLDDELFLQVARRLRQAGETPSWGRVIVRACFRFPREEMIADIETALDLAQQQGDVVEIGHAWWSLGFIAAENNQLDRAREHFERSLSFYRQFEDTYYIADGLAQLSGCHMKLGNIEKAQSCGSECLALRREINDQIGIVWCLNGEAAQSLWLGDYDLARPRLAEALDLIKTDNPDDDFILPFARSSRLYHVVCTTLGLIALLQGDREATQMYRQAIDPGNVTLADLALRYTPLMLPGIDDVLKGDYKTGKRLLTWVSTGQVLVWWWLDGPVAEWGLSLVYAGLGDFDQAQGHVKMSLQDGLARQGYMLLTSTLPVAALILAHNGDKIRAAELLGLAFTHPKSATGWMEQWPLLTRLRADLEAELGAEACNAAWEHGTKRDLEVTAADLLRHFDGDHHTRQEEANANLPESLTERELEVLSLLAQGHSNRKIAEGLVITVGTVKRYVYDICQKLEAENRTHAVARARALHLVP